MSDQTTLRSVLFVCTANQCRSPMAEALLKSLAAQRGETIAGKFNQPEHGRSRGIPQLNSRR